jgi:hypothetical protein
MQFDVDKGLPAEQRKWLRCDIDEDAKNPCIILARRDMLATAVRRGHKEPLFIDATHGIQKYGLKLVTAHIIDEENSGMHSSSCRWYACGMHVVCLSV